MKKKPESQNFHVKNSGKKIFEKGGTSLFKPKIDKLKIIWYICYMELWKTHPKLDGRYEFSNYGNFRNTETNKTLKNTIGTRGYVITFLRLRDSMVRKRIKIHKIIAELFVKNPNPELFKIVNHIDGNKTNNHYSNLEWVDDLKNIQHAIDNNLRKYSPKQKLTTQQVIDIREEYNLTTISIADLSRKYGVAHHNIRGILKYKYYGRVELDKKMTYKINSLTGEELSKWRKAKVRLKNYLKNSQKKIF